MKKKLYAVLLLALLVTACSSTKTNRKTNVGVDSTNKYAVEDTEANKKPLEDIIVFNEEGVTIRREGNNLIICKKSKCNKRLFNFKRSYWV